MPIEIAGITYFTAAKIHREVGVARQTLWRWRKARKIPQGRRYRDRQVVFTEEEVEAIRQYANRLEPAEPNPADQKKLFKAGSQKQRNA
jgi:predicted DNA-binding transcriptional regulator AlpA